MQPPKTQMQDILFRSVRTIQTINFFKKFKMQNDEIVSLAKTALLVPINKRSINKYLFKGDYDLHTIERMMSKLSFFGKLKDQHGLQLFQQVCKNLYYKKTLNEENIIQVNQPGKTFYVILSGSVSIKLLLPKDAEAIDVVKEVKTPKKKVTAVDQSPRYVANTPKHIIKLMSYEADFEPQEVNTLTVGDTFGEISLLDDYQRTTAIVDSKEDCEFACMDKKQFKEVLGKIRQKEMSDKLEFLRKVSFLSGWFETDLKTLSYHFESKFYEMNQMIFKEGDKNIDHLFLVRAGEVVLKKSLEKNVTKSLENQFAIIQNGRRDVRQRQDLMICKLSYGETFGEDAFLCYDQRQFSAQCQQGNTELFRISKANLERRLQHQQSQSVFDKLLAFKWQWRYDQMNQLFEKTEQNPSILENMKIQEHIATMSNLLVPEQLQNKQTQIAQTIINESPKNKKDQSPKIKQSQIISTSSNVLFSFMEAQKTFTALQSAKGPQLEDYQVKPKKLQLTNRTTIQSFVNLEKYKSPTTHRKTKTPIKQTKSFSKSIQSSTMHINSNIPSLNNFDVLKKQLFLPLEQKFTNYQQQYGSFDEELNDPKFKKLLYQYTKMNAFHNKNAIECNSPKAKIIDMYKGCTKDEMFSQSIDQLHYKRQTDNQIKVGLFLKQLKFMRKRLNVLNLIKQGIIICDSNHYVNDEGVIVAFQKQKEEQDEQLIVNGNYSHGPKFNFVNTRNEVKEKQRINQVDVMIDELQQQIDQLEEATQNANLKTTKTQTKYTLQSANFDTPNDEMAPLILLKPNFKVKKLNLDMIKLNDYKDISGTDQKFNQIQTARSSSRPNKILVQSGNQTARNGFQSLSTTPVLQARGIQGTPSNLRVGSSLLTQMSTKSFINSQNGSIMGFEVQTDANSIRFKRVLNY